MRSNNWTEYEQITCTLYTDTLKAYMKPNHLKIVTFWVDTWPKLHPPTQTQHTHTCARMIWPFKLHLDHTCFTYLPPYFAIFLMRSFELLSFFQSRGIWSWLWNNTSSYHEIALIFQQYVLTIQFHNSFTSKLDHPPMSASWIKQRVSRCFEFDVVKLLSQIRTAVIIVLHKLSGEWKC